MSFRVKAIVLSSCMAVAVASASLFPDKLVYPKNVATPVAVEEQGNGRRHQRSLSETRHHTHPDATASRTATSKSSLVPGQCNVTTPFAFRLSSGNGHGLICVMRQDHDDDLPQLELEMATEQERGSILNYAGDTGVPNCLGLNEGDASVGLPFLFHQIPPQGAAAHMTCAQPYDFVLVLLDDVGDQEGVQIQATTTTTGQEAATTRQVVHPTLVDARARITDIDVQAYESVLRHPGIGPETRTDRIHVSRGGDDDDDDVALEDDVDGDIAVLQYQIQDEGGNTFQRTFISSTPKPITETLDSIEVASTRVTVDGDLEIVLSGLFGDDNDEDDGEPVLGGDAGSDIDESHLLCTVRVGLQWTEDEEQESLVDISTMVSRHWPVVVLHAGWVRKRLYELRGDHQEAASGEGWHVVVEDALCEDPKDGYQRTNQLHHSSRNRKLLLLDADHSADNNGLLSHKEARRLFSQDPTPDELEINEDMLMGRPPSMPEDHRRRLDGVCIAQQHRFLLVHGWCSENNPWPEHEFASATHQYVTVKYENYGQNYAHDEFAQALLQTQWCPYWPYPDAHGNYVNVTGNVVAHSQGGAASLHMHQHYWSCLDKNGHRQGDARKLIQSVGTPYQGTDLAGTVAMLGEVLGLGCGRNQDMTEGGAAAWLGGIATWARQAVTYYRTQYKDRWWAWDYCHLLVHAVIGWPDDGTVEVARGALPGGNELVSVKQDQCHSLNMRDPPQCTDSSRNALMKSVAAVPELPEHAPTSCPAPAPGASP